MSNRVIELEARPAVLFSVLGLLLIAYAWPIWFQHQQFDRITTMEATIQQQTVILNAALGNALPVKMSPEWEGRLEELEATLADPNLSPKNESQAEEFIEKLSQLNQQFDRITTMEATIQQQTVILNAALGNALPVKMSPEWEGRLEELEATLADPNLSPKNESQAEEFIEKLSQLISELSPLSESSYFPRLSLVRWGAVAFHGLHRTPAPDEPLDNLVEQIRAIADAKPEGIVPDLEQRLRDTADDFANRAEEKLIESTIQQARRYLTSEKITGQDSFVPEASIGEVHEILGIYEIDSQRADEIRDLRTQLQHRIAIHEAQSQAAALNDQWAKAKTLATSQATVYETAANLLLREATAARAVLALQGIQEPIYDNLEGEIRRAVEEMQDKARREYQGWGLTQIVRFQKRHKAISDKASEDAKIWSKDNGGWSDDRYSEVKDAMVAYLLPINGALLDLPVLKRYQREFEEGWKRLDGQVRRRQSLAKASALNRKANSLQF